MIQLLKEDRTVLYELQKSDLLPDYISVLKEALAYAINLDGLYIDSENIDGLVWRETNFNFVSFRNCSMKRNTFLECTGNLQCFNCNLDHSKIKCSHFADVYFSDCELNQLSVRDSNWGNSFIIDSNLYNSIFWNNQFNTITFHTCNLSNVLYHQCTLGDSYFVYDKGEKDWYQNTSFIKCELHSCDMSYITDLSQLYFWETNILKIDFATDQQFSIIKSEKSKIIYAIDSDIIWWKPYSRFENHPFRHNVQEFLSEVNNNFPTTNIYSEMDDLDVKKELRAVCAYIQSCINENRR